jgi:hypothetical protein
VGSWDTSRQLVSDPCGSGSTTLLARRDRLDTWRLLVPDRPRDSAAGAQLPLPRSPASCRTSVPHSCSPAGRRWRRRWRWPCCRCCCCWWRVRRGWRSGRAWPWAWPLPASWPAQTSCRPSAPATPFGPTAAGHPSKIAQYEPVVRIWTILVRILIRLLKKSG